MAFLSGYTLRKEITIDNAFVDSDLSDFTIIVRFTDDADIGAAIDSNGYNIRFTAADGTTELKYERMAFDNGGSTATGIFFVKVPTVATAADTTIYIYYKSASPSDGQDAANAWNSNFIGVYHLQQDPSGSAPQMTDSTTNARHGTSAGTMTSGDLVAGHAGMSCLDFDGTNDEIAVAGFPFIAPPLTVEALVNPTSDNTDEYQHIVSRGGVFVNDTNYTLAGRRLATSEIRRLTGYWRNGSTLYGNESSDSAVTVGSWGHVANVVDGSYNQTLYYNATSVGTDGSNAIPTDGSQALRIGNASDSNQPYTGKIQEVRISNVARSAAWLKFTYRNLFESDNELTFGAEEEDAGGGGFQAAWARSSNILIGV